MLTPEGSRRCQLLSEPVVLESIANLANHVGVPVHLVDFVVHATRRTAYGALLRASSELPPFGADIDDTPERGRRDPIGNPPEDDIGFLCWLHGIESRKAARYARPLWDEQARRDEPFVTEAQRHAAHSVARPAASFRRDRRATHPRSANLGSEGSSSDRPPLTRLPASVRWLLRHPSRKQPRDELVTLVAMVTLSILQRR